ncbi:hydrogenase formation protein HypD [Desulfobacula sp.]|uniref:hydrogenase formation protein HypD n=1 Tax=Desulfobacula sp. TaxID=2593537 RepID=UPI0025C6DE97|nr:hydrogenase formation protein HypD [Desulfobacula sp.]MBC2705599.1 hydrogenase formation protein HypD [Desulfobacula sp.]
MVLKYIEEYRDGSLARDLVKKIHSVSKKDLRLMEVCGTHTTAIFRHGIRSVLPQGITLLSGPGCPVCVTAQKDIDAFVGFARVKNVIVTTFGDLIKVPGSSSTLGKEKAAGADVRIVYSVFDAVNIARENKDKEVVFCGVGFETTIPTIAAGILMGIEGQVDNFSVYSANKLTPPALAALMETDGVELDGFILPGHVSVITGTDAYRDTFEKYDIPSVISGFEPIDILQAILLLIEQNEAGKPALENAYPRAVSDVGNVKAKQIMNQVFEVCNASWRGIGEIPSSGMELKKEYQKFDAAIKFGMDMPDVPEPKGCACGEILMGLKRPYECALYKKKCTPLNPVGPCMVSSEGSCAAFYRYS